MGNDPVTVRNNRTYRGRRRAEAKSIRTFGEYPIERWVEYWRRVNNPGLPANIEDVAKSNEELADGFIYGLWPDKWNIGSQS